MEATFFSDLSRDLVLNVFSSVFLIYESFGWSFSSITHVPESEIIFGNSFKLSHKGNCTAQGI